MLTETWLNSNHNQWKNTTILNINQLRLHAADHDNGKGGGLALIHRSHYPVRTITSGHRSSSEFACWELKVKNHTITVHGIYHPPYSLTNKVTNSKFIKEFTDYVSTCLPEHPNHIFIGDFNLHISDELDMDATIFNDSIDALDLYQHVGFVMHKSGNVLDLILSDFTNPTMVLTTALGPYVTNHRAVIGTLSIKKLRPKQLTAMVRQTSKVSDQQWNDEFNPDNVDLTGKLDTLVSSFNTELRRVYDTLAPQKEIKVNLRPKQPWYDQEIKTLKRKVCKYEKKWLKYKMDSLWIAYKKVRNSYYGTLNAKKKAVLQVKIHNCTKDSRKLHALVNNLTTKHTEEEWPEHTSNDELAEGFASYFQGKIEKIRDLLKNKPKYKPTPMDMPELKNRSVRLSLLLSLSSVN